MKKDLIISALLQNHKMGIESRNLGTIELKNDVMVSDPCYELGTWCQGIVGGIKAGKFNAYAIVTDEGDWGERIAELVVIREDADIEGINEELDFEVGVDSGQAGIFNFDYYKEKQPDDDWDNPESWYRRVCDITCSDEDCGTIDNEGVVSSSGYGDGGYVCYAAYENEEIVALRIVFIEDYDEEDD